MTLERLDRASGQVVRLVECSVSWCDEAWPDTHSGAARRAHFLNDHAPEDFGMEPLRGNR